MCWLDTARFYCETPLLDCIEDATTTPTPFFHNEREQEVFAYVTHEGTNEVKVGSGSIVRTLVIKRQRSKYIINEAKWYQWLYPLH